MYLVQKLFVMEILIIVILFLMFLILWLIKLPSMFRVPGQVNGPKLPTMGPKFIFCKDFVAPQTIVHCYLDVL